MSEIVLTKKEAEKMRKKVEAGEIVFNFDVEDISEERQGLIASSVKKYVLERFGRSSGGAFVIPPGVVKPDFRIFLEIDLPEVQSHQWVQYLPSPGKYMHPEYGMLNITEERAERFVKNYNDEVYQRQLPIDAEHQTKVSGAVGWIRAFRKNPDGTVDAFIEWTERGLKFLRDRAFKYFSPEWYEKWTDPATNETFEDVATGGALTTKPFFKDGVMRPVLASELIPQGGGIEDPSPGNNDNDFPQGGKIMGDETQEFTDLQTLVEGLQTELGDLSTQVTTLTEEKDSALSKAEALEAARESDQEQLKTATKEVTALKTAERVRRFQEIVAGNGNGQAPWSGEVEVHVGALEMYADTYGEDSDEMEAFVKNQNAMAQQIAESSLFDTKGSDQSGSLGEASEEIDKKVGELMEKDKTLTKEQAMTEVVLNDPKLYDQYREEV